MKMKKKNGGKYEIEFDKIQKVVEVFDRESVVNQINKIQFNIDAGIADKAKYEEILALIDKK